MHNPTTGELEPAHYRVSKSAWIQDVEHKCVRDVGQRVNDMTGLDMKSAEHLQVVNYGIGGHYEPHFDFFSSEDVVEDRNNNRIATVLFYVRITISSRAAILAVID